jgi:hypothetical protein
MVEREPARHTLKHSAITWAMQDGASIPSNESTGICPRSINGALFLLLKRVRDDWFWWSRQDSNLRPLASEASDLSTDLRDQLGVFLGWWRGQNHEYSIKPCS